MRYPAVAVAVALAAGASIGAAWPVAPATTTLGLILALVGAVAAWRTGRGRLVVPIALAGIAVAGAALERAALQRALRPPLVVLLEAHGRLASDQPPGESVPTRLEGRLRGDATAVGRGIQFRLGVERAWLGPCGCPEPASGDVVVTVAGEQATRASLTWRAGRRVSVVGVVRRPVVLRNPGAPDADLQVARRRAALVVSVKSAYLVEVVGQGPWSSEAAAAIRARARAALARASGAGAEATAVGMAVLIGDRAGLEAPLEDRLQRAGTYHVIAISGGNIALWAAIAIGVARRLARHRLPALAAAATALAAYAAIVGGGASVLRATGMALIGLACQAADQRGAIVNVLALTAAAIVVVDPLTVLDAGFWLTTAATAGIVVGLPEAVDAAWPGRMARALVHTSVWAEAALLPIVAVVFQQVTLAGVLLSALAIPAMAVVQLAALAAVVADAVAPAALSVIGVVLHVSTAAVTASARLVDWCPWLAWKVPPPATTAIVVYYALLILWLWARRTGVDAPLGARVRRLTAVATPAAAVWIATSPLTLVPVPSGDLQFTAFDVGQGDALLLVFPSGRRMLVDAGGTSGEGRDLGGRVVAPALRSMGVRRLDYLVVTHPDADHLGGAVTIAREFRPTEVWTGIAVNDHAPSLALRAAAREVGAAWRQVRRGEVLAIDDVVVRVRHPPAPEWERRRPRNDDSVVLDVRRGAVRLWLTGDIGAEVERSLAADVTDDPDGVAVTVLKVAHHGSASATTEPWLAVARPAVAVVSAGAVNPFGHPAPAVVARLARSGADLWRTDRDGAITVRTNGQAVRVAAQSGRAAWLAPQPR